ncbi:MAG: helix-turn-helix domain-containing protein, partial [Acidimicrobiales bacterium]
FVKQAEPDGSVGPPFRGATPPVVPASARAVPLFSVLNGPADTNNNVGPAGVDADLYGYFGPTSTTTTTTPSSLLRCRVTPGIVQGMDGTAGITPVASPALRSSAAAAADPVVAEVGPVRLRWHARSLRGSRTIVDAARLIGINRDELSRIERGETKQIQFQTVAKFLAAYGCALTDLFEVEPAAPEQAPTPLYVHVVKALAHGTLPLQPVRRRAVRRAAEPDVTSTADEAAFSPSGPDAPPRRRQRAAAGTLNR